MQNTFSKFVCDGESFALANNENNFPLASAGDAASAISMKRHFCTDPVFEATSAALEPTSSPSRLVCDPMLAQFDDALLAENGFELSPLSYDEAREWFFNESPKSNGERFSEQLVGCAVVEPSEECFSRFVKNVCNTTVDVSTLIGDPILTVSRTDSGPLSPAPMAHVKMEVKSECASDSRNTIYNSRALCDSDNSRVVKRGRPMKITSRSKQALYAREYRRKNKQALWDYERRVKEQDNEIMRLRDQNRVMQEKLSKLVYMKNAIAKQYDTAVRNHDPLMVTVAEIRSSLCTKRLLNSIGSSDFCVHVSGNNFLVLSCEACNMRKTEGSNHMSGQIIGERLELSNSGFESIEDFIG